MESLLKMIRSILGNERETPECDAQPQTKKGADGTFSASAPSKPEPPRFVDSQRNPDLPDTKKWAELNKPTFTRRSRWVTVAVRRNGGAALVRRDLLSGELEPENEGPFALKVPEK